MTSADKTIDRLIANAGPLYSLPAVAVQVVALLDNASVDTRALKDCIEHDPALTGKLLRVVNSTLFGLSRQVSDLNQAIALLGIKPLKLLVLGFSLPPGLFQGAAPWVLEWYWRHSLTKAAAARQISRRIWHKPGDEAFLAGLLQDVGILVLSPQLGEPYLRLLESAARGADLRTLERQALGFDHVEVSRRLLQSWGLPPSLCAAESPPDEQGPVAAATLAQIVALAEHAARWIAEGQVLALRSLLASDAALPRPLEAAEIEAILGDLDAVMLPLGEAFHLPVFAGDRARELIVRAHRQLSEVAAEAAAGLLRSPAETGDPVDLPAQLECIRELAAQLVRPANAAAQGVAVVAVPKERHTAVATAEPGVIAGLKRALAAARQSRTPLSLLLVSMDAAEDATAGERSDGASLMEAACRQIDYPGMTCISDGETKRGLILPDCTRREAIELAGDWLDHARRAAAGRSDAGPVRLAAGIATVSLVSKNFPAEELYGAANRCLYASHAGGSGVAKSIEL